MGFRGNFKAPLVESIPARAAGAAPGESEDLINEPQRIGSVVAAAMFVEQPDGVIKVSLRSKRDVNVAAIAAAFGGGGHERAAGLRVTGSLESVKRQVTDAVLAAMKTG